MVAVGKGKKSSTRASGNSGKGHDMTNRSSESPASFFQDDMRFNKVHEVVIGVQISRREKIRVEESAAFADQSHVLESHGLPPRPRGDDEQGCRGNREQGLTSASSSVSIVSALLSTWQGGRGSDRREFGSTVRVALRIPARRRDSSGVSQARGASWINTDPLCDL